MPSLGHFHGGALPRVIVKNTFIDLYEPSTQQHHPRSSSLPPRLSRKSSDRPKTWKFEEWLEASTEASEGDSDSSCVTDHWPVPDVVPSLSSVDTAPAETRATKAVPCFDADGPDDCSHLWCSVLNPRAPVWCPSTEPYVPYENEGAKAISLFSAVVSKWDVGPLDANAWELGSSPSDWERQLAMGVVAAATAALACDHVVDAVETCDGWSIVSHVHPSEQETFLYRAKEELLRAAELSVNVYIVGYCAEPFIQRKSGFAATLGVMADETSACWDFFLNGTCCGACGWQHAALTLPVEVVANLVGE